MRRDSPLGSRLLRWSKAGATVILGVALTLEILGAADLGSQGYSGLILRHDRVVGRVVPGSPAAGSGFRRGDVLRTVFASPPPRPGDRVVVDVRRGSQELSLPLAYTSLPAAEKAQRFSFGLVAIAFFLVGYVVYVRRLDGTATVFALFCLDLGLLLMNKQQGLMIAWPLGAKVLYDALVLLLAPLFLHFFFIFPERRPMIRRHPGIIPLLYLPSLTALAVSVPLNIDLLREGTPPGRGVYLFEGATVIYFLGCFIAGVVLFVSNYRRAVQPHMRRRLKGVVVGTALGVIPLAVVTALMNFRPELEIPGDRFAPLPLILLPVSFGHAIVRYGLLDVEIFLKRGAVYTILSASLLAVYLAVVVGLGQIVESVAPAGSRAALTVVAVIIMAAAFSPLRLHVERWVDRIFYRDKYSYRETLREFSRALAHMMDLERMLDLLAERVDETFHPERLTLFLREAPGGDYRAVRYRGDSVGGPSLRFRAPDEVPRLLAADGEPMALERFAPGGFFGHISLRERRILARAGSAVLVPFVSEAELVGFLALGPKRSQEFMSVEDVELLGTLADHAAAAVENAQLHQEDLARQRLEQELAVAREVQQTLLPPAQPELEGLEFAGISLPSAEIGGDLYDYMSLGPERVAIAIGDAIGKGVPAALLMASLQATVRGEAESGRDPGRVVTVVNRRLCERTDETSFVSLFYGEIDLARGVLTYVNAGHQPPFLVVPEGGTRSLECGGLILGVKSDAEYETETIPLVPDSLLVLYTDGIPEETDSAGEEFGLERLKRLVEGMTNLSASEVTDSILGAVKAFGGAGEPDDITLVAIRYQGSPARRPEKPAPHTSAPSETR